MTVPGLGEKMGDIPDQILIARAKKGDKNAVATLYRRYVDQITRYVSYRIGDEAAVEDVVGNIFLKMVEQLPRFRWTGAPFEAWLYRIASGHVADFYRKQKLHAQLPEDLSSQQPSLEVAVQEKQEFENLRNMLATLKDDYQTVLILRFIEQRSHEEVALIMGKSAGAVMTLQHRALKRLAELLGTEKQSRHYLRGEG